MAGATFTSTTSFQDVTKTVYEPLMRDLSVTETELQDLFTEEENFSIQEGPDGKSINIAHLFSWGGGVSWMSQSDYIPAAQDPSIKQSSITIKQVGTTVEMSGQVMRRVKEGPAAYATWAQRVLPAKVQRLAFHKDTSLMGAGTGILFQVNMATPASTGLGINNAFGISGLAGSVNLIYLGDGIRIAADAAGATLRSGAAVVQKLAYSAATIDIDALPTSTANGDFISLGDANVNTFGKTNMGLLGIVDDGTVVPTFQNLSRSSFPLLQGQILNATTANGGIYNGQFGEELLDFADSVVYERGLGKPDVVVMNRSGRRAFWKDLKDDRRINDPAGSYTGGRSDDGLKMILGDRTVGLKVCRKCPTDRVFLLQKDTLKMFRVGPGRWDDTTGSIWNRSIDSTGRKDAYFAFYLEEYEVACDAPNRNLQITNCAAA
jgi:hypothetical protein